MIDGNVAAPVASGEPRPAPAVVLPLSTGGGQPPQPASPPVQQKSAPPVEISADEARALAQELGERLDVNRFRVEVSVDEQTRAFVFSIYHSGTGKLIRQFPPEGILFMAQQLKSASPSGILLDEQV